jgi:hypothetical protein
MNKQFTTDELVSWLCGGQVAVPVRLIPGSDDKYFRDAIIDRLRNEGKSYVKVMESMQ